MEIYAFNKRHRYVDGKEKTISSSGTVALFQSQFTIISLAHIGSSVVIAF